jgi:hypothetical protein
MSRGLLGDFNYPNQDTIASANTAQLLALGSETTTFAVDVKFVTIMYASKACYIAKDSTNVDANAGGAVDDRIYVPEGASGITLPWGGRDVYFKNAVAGETPTLYVVGLA